MLASLQPYGTSSVGIDFLIISTNTSPSFFLTSCTIFGHRRLVKLEKVFWLVKQEKVFLYVTVESPMVIAAEWCQNNRGNAKIYK